MLKYLRNVPNDSAQDLILRAVRAFWLPLALQSHAGGAKSKTELKQIGRIAIYDLLHQIEHLCAALELERPFALQLGQLSDAETQKPAAPAPPQAEASQSATRLLLQTADAGATWNASIEDL